MISKIFKLGKFQEKGPKRDVFRKVKSSLMYRKYFNPKNPHAYSKKDNKNGHLNVLAHPVDKNQNNFKRLPQKL